MIYIILILSILFFCFSLYSLHKNKQVTIDKTKELREKEQLNQQIASLYFQKQQIEKDNAAIETELINTKNNLNTAKNNLNTVQANLNDAKNDLIATETHLSTAKNYLKDIQKEADQLYANEQKIVNQRIQDFKKIAQKSANYYVENLEKAYETADAAHKQKIASLKQEQASAAADLQKIKETRKATYQALLKEKEVKENKDAYCLRPSQSELYDISKLEKIKKELSQPRILSMLIWQTYWQPLAKKQFPIILKDKTKMGIYKITNLITNECYIGQSVDIYKRWMDHCKASLGIDTPVGNKLYKAVQDFGLQNFAFELLLQCSREELNEKEKYFIELYQADLYGYNGNLGVGHACKN